MHKTIIAVHGLGSSGKTTSIRFAHDRLIEEGGEIREQGSRGKERRRAILVIDGVLVGFASPGDRPDYLGNDLAYLIKAGCAVIVCATHTSRSETYWLVERLASEAQPPFEVVRIQKDRDTDHEEANSQTAEEIIVAVRKAIHPMSASPLAA